MNEDILFVLVVKGKEKQLLIVFYLSRSFDQTNPSICTIGIVLLLQGCVSGWS